jgi:hypothetical protein
MIFIVTASGDRKPACRRPAGQQTLAPGANTVFLVTADAPTYDLGHESAVRRNERSMEHAVQDVRDGRADLSIRETVSAATPYIWSVAAASILAGFAITIGLILIIVPGLWLITIWAVIIPVIVIERSGALASFGRSRQLVRGHGWHVFGTLVLVFIILIVVDLVLGIIFVALPIVLRSGLGTVISGTLVAPFLAVIVTLIYYRLVGTNGGGPAAQGGYAEGPGYGQGPGVAP